MSILRTIAMFVYLFGYMIVHYGVLRRAERLLAAGDTEAVRAIVVQHIPHWAKGILRVTGVQLTVDGLENIPKNTACVFVGNHRSYYDIPLLLAGLDQPYGILAKEELAKIPLLNRWMKLLGCVFVQRDDVRASVRALNDASAIVESGRSFVIFPEGTRYKGEEGGAGEFKAGAFRIKSEASVASGVRRIEATVGQLTLDTINRNQQVLFHIAQMFKTNPGELENRLEQQMNEMKDLRHELEKFKEQASLGEARSFLASAKTVGELKVITAQRDGMDAAAMRKQGDFLRDKEPGVVGVLASVNDGKVTLLAVCGKDAVAKGVKAGDIIKAIAPICGGKGGGKPDSAMGGGTEVSKVDDALAAVDDFVAGKL